MKKTITLIASQLEEPADMATPFNINIAVGVSKKQFRKLVSENADATKYEIHQQLWERVADAIVLTYLKMQIPQRNNIDGIPTSGRWGERNDSGLNELIFKMNFGDYERTGGWWSFRTGDASNAGEMIPEIDPTAQNELPEWIDRYWPKYRVKS